MLKRNIAILIAGALLSAQAGLAAAGPAYLPSNDTEVFWAPLPGQLKYFEARAASIQKEGVVLRGDSFPPAAEDLASKMLPAQVQYFAQREVSNQTARLGEVAVNITASTKYINAEHDAVLVVKNGQGQSFTWRADTVGEADIPLKAIAPADFAAGETRVHVHHPMDHISGG